MTVTRSSDHTVVSSVYPYLITDPCASHDRNIIIVVTCFISIFVIKLHVTQAFQSIHCIQFIKVS